MHTAAAARSILRLLATLASCGAVVPGAWLLAGEPFLAVARPLVADGPSTLDTLAFTDLLTACCAAALLVCAGWVVFTAALMTATRLATVLVPGSAMLATCSRLAERACPRVARAALVGLLGLGAGTATAGPALADPSGTGSTTSSTRTSTGTSSGTSPGGLDGLAVPDRAVGGAPTAGTSRTTPPTPPRVVHVQRGDSLWTIAGRLLPAGAADARVTEAWHRLHHANHSRIGDDPDLIFPGTRLMVPDLLEPHRKEQP